MQTVCLRDPSELAPYADDWNGLADGMPMHRWEWFCTWWTHYGHPSAGPARLLNVVCLFDESGRLIGVAPWYLEERSTTGRVLRMLGDGEVCTDYPTILAQPGREETVVDALADYLEASQSPSADGRLDGDLRPWDLLDLEAVVEGDGVLNQLLAELDRRGHTVHRRPGPGVWRIELPTDWETYLKRLSKGHRKRARRILRELGDTTRVRVEVVERIDQLPGTMDTLIELHQRRWRSQGEPGAFASPRFEAFHRDVAERLLRAGHLRLSVIHLDDSPVAAEYQLSGRGTLYTYQAGIDPDRLDAEPGRLANALVIRGAIGSGYRAIDFMRGDEPYKEHFRAERTPTHHVRVVAPRPSAALRHRAWLAARTVKQWTDRGRQLLPSAS